MTYQAAFTIFSRYSIAFPLPNARSARICKYSRSDVFKRSSYRVPLHGCANLLGAWRAQERGLRFFRILGLSSSDMKSFYLDRETSAFRLFRQIGYPCLHSMIQSNSRVLRSLERTMSS